MNLKTADSNDWRKIAGYSGAAAVIFYFSAAFMPLPGAIVMILAFSFGPLLIISFISIYRFMSDYHDGPIIQFASLLGVIAGIMVTIMLVVQIGNNMVRSDLLSSAETEAVKESIKLSWGAVNRVQYLVDVVWDIFICGATILLGVAMLRHPRFGKIWGGSGIIASAALLYLNIYYFPTAPAYSGSIDLGPLLAVWMLAIYVRLLLIKSPQTEI